MEKRQLFKLSIVAASILAPTFKLYAATTSPFAPLPLDRSGSVQSSAQPNVLLVLDNSRSMNFIAEADIYPSFTAAKQECEQSYKQYYASQYPNLIWSFSANTDGTGTYRGTCSYQDGYYGHPKVLTTFDYCPTTYRAGSSAYRDYATCQTTDATQRPSRMNSLKSVMTPIINNPNNASVRWGVNYLNYNPVNNAKDVALASNNSTAVVTSINNVVGFGGTPLTQNYAKAAKSNFIDGNAIQYRCQKNFIIALTDGDAYGTDSIARWYTDNWSGTNTVDASNWNNPNINSTDWLANVNGDYGMQALSYILANKDLKTSGTDNEGGDWNDLNFNNGKQTVTTSTVGFGLENAYLKNAPQGTGSAFYKASNATELSAALNKLVNNATASASGYATFTPSTSGSSSTNLGSLALTLDLANGASTFEFLNLARNADGELKATTDKTKSISYGTLTDNSSTSSTRRVLFSSTATAPKFLAATDVNWTGVTSSSSPNNTQYLNWLLRNSNLTDTAISSSLRKRADSATDAKRMMGDVIGSSVLQVGNTSTTTSTTRQFKPYLVTAANDGMLHMFKRNDSDTAQPYSLLANWIPGAASRETDSSTSTVETLWAGVKNTTDSNYLSSISHTHLMNGGIGYRTTYNGQSFAVGALGQGGKGAYAFNIGGNDHASTSTKVGMDAAQADWTSKIPLWETANNKFAGAQADTTTWTENQKLGYTVSTPVIDRVATTRSSGSPVFSNPIRYAAAVSNGYFGSDSLPSLYVYDALGVGMTYTTDAKNKPTTAGTPTLSSTPGKLLAKIQVPTDTANSAKITVTTDNSLTSMNNGLSAPALVDMDKDGVVDLAYAGDLNGNLYRFDLRKDTPSTWSATRIFKGSPNNPITAAPAVYRSSDSQLIVMFGTGRELFSSDLGTTTDQYFYGLYDNINSSGSEIDVASRDSVLEKQTITSNTVNGTTYRFLSNNDTLGDSKKGWYIPLGTGTGERVTVQPTVVDNSVFFTTRIYQADTSQAGLICKKTSNSGYSWLMGASVKTGANLAKKTTNLGYYTQTVEAQPTNVYYSGLKLSGIASGTSFSFNMESSSSSANNYTYSRNDQGQSQSGYDVDLTKDQSIISKVNYCSSTSSGDLILTDSVSGFNAKKVYNRACAAGIRRISWREIF